MEGRWHQLGFLWGLALLFLAASPAAAQVELDELKLSQPPGPPPEKIVTVAAEFTTPAGGKPGRLFITAEIAEGWHIYSLSQKPGGPIKSKIKLDDSQQFKLTGDFKPFPDFEKHREPSFDNLEVEQHEGKVTWYAPLELAAGVEADKLKISGKLSFQACNDSACMPPETVKFEAKLGKGIDVEKKAERPADKK